MHRLQIAEELQRVLAYGIGLPGVDAIEFAGGQHALPALPLELLMRHCLGVLLGQHLGQNAVAQPQRCIE